MNIRIALSSLSILTALALMGGTALALFTDPASSQDNTFSTGNADLQIASEGEDSPGIYVDDLPAPAFSGDDMAPGFNEDYVFWLKNNSSSEIGLDLTVNLDDIVGSNEDLQDALNITFTCTLQGGDATVSSAGPFTVNEWEVGIAQPLGTLLTKDDGFDGLGTDEMECVMNVALDEDANNDVAGGSVSFDGIFDATQAI